MTIRVTQPGSGKLIRIIHTNDDADATRIMIDWARFGYTVVLSNGK